MFSLVLLVLLIVYPKIQCNIEKPFVAIQEYEHSMQMSDTFIIFWNVHVKNNTVFFDNVFTIHYSVD